MASTERPQTTIILDPLASGLTQGRRVYRREWKRYRPHLQKSTSLPNLHLPPPNRPMFSCFQCGFTNTLGIPLCPWCFWTSESAKEAFERSDMVLRRQRRVSAPPRVFWKQSDLTPTTAPSTTRPNAVSKPLMSELRTRRFKPVIISSAEVPTGTSATGVLDEHLTITSNAGHRGEQHSSTTKAKPNQYHQDVGGDRVAANKSIAPNCLDNNSGLLGDTQERTSRSAAVVAQLNGPIIEAPVVIVSPDTTIASSSPASAKGSDALSDVNQRLTPASTKGASTIKRLRTKESMKTSLSHSGVDRLVDLSHIKTTSMQSLRSAHLVIDIKPRNDIYGTFHANKPLNLHDGADSRPTSAKTLRRKGNVSVFRISNSTTGVTSVFETDSEATDSRPASSTFSPTSLPLPIEDEEEEHFRKHSRPKSEPIDVPIPNVPLGHPSRPYYTAIRPNKMSPPTSASYNASSWGRGRLSFQPLPPAPRPTSLPAQSNLPERCVSPGIVSVLSAPCHGSADSAVPSAFLRPETPVLDPAMLSSPPSPNRSHFHSLGRMFSSKRRPATSIGLFEPTSSPDYTPLSASPKIKIQQAHAALAGSLSKSRHTTGFSLSGETEMKMALANSRKEAAAAADYASSSSSCCGHGNGGRGRSRTVAGDEFRFKQTSVHHRNGSIGNVARKMKEGFREFVMKRTLSPAW